MKNVSGTVIRGMAAKNIDKDNQKARAFKEKYKINSNLETDTNIRIKIHEIIRNNVSKGINKKDIIDELSKNEKFKKYEIYFENWIGDQYKKSGVKLDIDNDEER